MDRTKLKSDEAKRIRKMIQEMKWLRRNAPMGHSFKRRHSTQRHRGCRGDSY